ncbi:hypothetical protein Tco_0625147 [Tanacetum coccineum]|uniref:Uncharacterized protein n=1 Tax=Tanacetum coccineum TaxID=301880 RepID=A0ABQ4WG12_9ASTR
MHEVPFFFHLNQVLPIQHAVAIASAQKNKESLEADSIVQAALMRVRNYWGLKMFFGTSWRKSFKTSGGHPLGTLKESPIFDLNELSFAFSTSQGKHFDTLTTSVLVNLSQLLSLKSKLELMKLVLEEILYRVSVPDYG